MHLTLNSHYFFLVVALVLGILAMINVPSTRINLLAGSFTAYLLAVFFT